MGLRSDVSWFIYRYNSYNPGYNLHELVRYIYHKPSFFQPQKSKATERNNARKRGAPSCITELPRKDALGVTA